MTELLVHPYRQGDDRRVGEFYALLSTYPNLTWIAPGLGVADAAARLRAAHRMRTPDALQAATAIAAGVRGFVTNDRVFARIESFETLVWTSFFERQLYRSTRSTFLPVTTSMVSTMAFRLSPLLSSNSAKRPSPLRPRY